ncbi:MAG: Ger(x)C family spore germination protein [Christensenellaceae bacterium]|jgi:Ger(x)C family germination protein|nr:Ger(x)C family spore germination protein [Christensenellaceae bacterium]
MKKITTVLTISIIMSIFLIVVSSCYASVEPRNMTVVNSTIFDFDGQYYHIMAEIINPTKTSEGNTDSSTSSDRIGLVLKGKGKTMSQAIVDIEKKVEKKVLGTHNRVRFITERMASNLFVMNEFIDFFIRNDDYDERPWLIVIKDEYKDLLYSANIGLATLMGEYIHGLAESQPVDTGEGVFSETLKFITDSLTKGIEPVCGRVVLEEMKEEHQNDLKKSNNKKYVLIVDGLAVFKGITFMGFLDSDGAVVYNILTGAIKTTRMSVKDQGFHVGVKINNFTSKITPKTVDGKVNIDIKVSGALRLEEINAKVNTSEEMLLLIEKIKNATEIKIQKQLLNTIGVMQHTYGIDIFGIGIKLHIKDPKAWKGISENWNEVFSKANVNVSVVLKTVQVGEFSLPYYI